MLAVDLEQTEIVDILLRRPDVDVTVINKVCTQLDTKYVSTLVCMF